MLTPDELNKIIEEMQLYKEENLPYNKGKIHRFDVIRILKNFTNYELDEDKIEN